MTLQVITETTDRNQAGNKDVPGPSEDKQTRDGPMISVTAPLSQSQKSVRPTK